MTTDPDQPAVTPGSSIEWFPLAWTGDQGDLIVGRPDSGGFVTFPRAAEPLLEDLYGGATPAAAAAAFASRTGRSVDAVTFVSTLAGRGFVRSVDGVPVPAPPLRRPSLSAVKPHHVRWIASPWFLGPASAVTLCGLVLGVLNGSVTVGPDDWFAFPSPLANIVLNLLIPAVFILLHELAHLFMARAHGQPGRIRMSTRLMFVVAETDVSSIRLIARAGRLKTYLAGMGLDLFFVALTSVAPYPGSPGLVAVSRGVALFLVSAVAMQAACFMRTDVYFVLQDLVRRPNLFSDTMTALRTAPVRTFTRNGDPITRAYSAVVVLGVTGAFLWFGTVGVGILAGLVTRSWHSVEAGLAVGDPLAIADGSLSIAVEALLYAFVLVRWSARLVRRVRRAAATRHPGPASTIHSGPGSSTVDVGRPSTHTGTCGNRYP